MNSSAAKFKTSRSEAKDEAKVNALSASSARSVQDLSYADLNDLKALLRHGDDFEYWETPKNWAPTISAKSMLKVDVRRRIIHNLPVAFRKILELTSSKAVLNEHIHQEIIRNRGLSSEREIHSVLDQAVLSSIRYLVLLRIGPVGLGRRGSFSSLDPSSLRQLAHQALPLMASIAAAKILRIGVAQDALCSVQPTNLKHNSFFGLLDDDDLNNLSTSQKKVVSLEILRMRVLNERGFWNDSPAAGFRESAAFAVSNGDRTFKSNKKIEPHLPLPDDYVSEMGINSLWIIEELGPNILRIGGDILKIWDRTNNQTLSPSEIQNIRRSEVKKYLCGASWKDRNHNSISGLPFQQKLYKSKINELRELTIDHSTSITVYSDPIRADSDDPNPGRKEGIGTFLKWPPRNFADIMALFATLQQAHLFIVALSIGARGSEIIALTRDCISYGRDGEIYASGLTFKLIKSHNGEVREWILPAIAAISIEQQTRLVSLVEKIGPQIPDFDGADATKQSSALTHLWAQLPGVGLGERLQPLCNLRPAFARYANTLGLQPSPGGQNLRPHRFRKTVARLVALALTQAPKILMSLFGHKSIEMTMYYILTDKDLLAEIEVVARELRVMQAKEVITDILAKEDELNELPPFGDYGGPAAANIMTALASKKEELRSSQTIWKASDTLELAELLTLQGRAWQLVRPGVICTKFPGTESGPCNKSKGYPETSQCRTFCQHRLDQKFLREDVDGAIKEALIAYEKAAENNDELMQSMWAGQVRSHLLRFDDIGLRWRHDPGARSLIAKIDSEI